MTYNKVALTAIVFDFDGTLAELNIDFPLMRTRILDLIISFGVRPDGLEDLFALEMVAEGGKLIARAHPGQESEFIRKANDLIRSIELEGARRGRLFEGVEDMLVDLRNRNIKVGIVTRNCYDAVTCLYPGLEKYCHAFITRESTARVKPDPEQLHMALAAMDATPYRSAMVGDHPMDISVGKNVGTYTIGVLTGYAHEALLRDAGADYILKTATDIITLI